LEPASRKQFAEIFVVYKYMSTTLHKVITSGNELNDDSIQLFIYQILRGLKYIHSAGVLHRDLKPTNILLNRNCDLKICDFGCGRSSGKNLSGRTLKMTLLENVATRWYRAPEGLVGCSDYTSAVDVWSTGCILAELLGREVLFRAEDNNKQLEIVLNVLGTPSSEELEKLEPKYREVLQRYSGVPSQSLSQRFRTASPEAIDLLEKMLRLDPMGRITVTEALSHPYLISLHDEKDEPVAEFQFQEGFTKEAHTLKDFKELLYNEIMDLRQKGVAVRPGDAIGHVEGVRCEEESQPANPTAPSTQVSLGQQPRSVN